MKTIDPAAEKRGQFASVIMHITYYIGISNYQVTRADESPVIRINRNSMEETIRMVVVGEMERVPF
jgi:hypothetical protein